MCTTPKTTKTIKNWTMIAGAIIVTGSVVTLAWSNLAEPRINRLIDDKIKVDKIDLYIKLDKINDKQDMLLERISKIEGKLEK